VPVISGAPVPDAVSAMPAPALAAVEAVAGSPSASQAVAMAENHIAGTAAVLAQGIVAAAPSTSTS
jgi:hypothetical protein